MLPAKFRPREIVVTPGAVLALKEAGLDPFFFLDKHLSGDWGDVDESGRAANDEALRNGGRVVSSYKTPLGKRLGVVTPADRSVTVVYELPEEC